MPKNNLDQDFMREVKSFFLREKEGNLGPYLYSESNPLITDDRVCGEEYYQKIIYENPNYYLYKDEVALIQETADRLSDHVPADSTIIELGPGTEQAFLGKTIPFLKAAQPYQYIAVDLCEKYLVNAGKLVNDLFPGISIKTLKKDFFKDIDWMRDYKEAVVFFKGSTITNLDSGQCCGFLQAISQVLKPDGKLIVGIDSNQEERSLRLAYENLDVSNFILNIFQRINRDLPINLFDPDRFTYKFNWVSEEHCVKHQVVAVKAQEFELDGIPFEVAQGEVFHLMSSFKYPVDLFQSMAEQSGLIALDCYRNNNKRMGIHILKAKT
ncbi:MAG: L-histidine N(alpha)-methyltransferase [Cyanobacteria bacterium P01_G01_bin.54]